ncbi:MAG: hypothetical protein OEW40_08130 [Cyclobacteriaceae bacterium]|nr:hypothetical protein [Cyclobacteriaceae bacterium]
MGQNTKGDKPSTNRESRFKTTFRKGGSKRKTTTNKRVRSNEKSIAGRANASSPGRASGKDRPGKPLRPIAKSAPSKEKAWRGDIAGYRVRSTKRSKSPAGTSRNVYPQHGMFVHNPSKKPKRGERAVSNRSQLARLEVLQSKERPPSGPKRKVVPRSASRAFIARKSINVYASFPRPKRRGEHATTKDLAGRKLRSKNFETPRPKVIPPASMPYYGRRPMGDKPYGGKTSGGYRSATRAGQHPWKGDIAGRRIRSRNFSSHKEGKIILPTAAKDRYGLGSARIGIFQGNIKVKKKPEKGGGSVSGQGWNNNGQTIGGGRPGRASAMGRFQGNLKAKRQEKGGGSVSGQPWNNNGQTIGGGRPGRGSTMGRFQGNLKARRPDKGGGSVSGKVWNNNGQPIGGGLPEQGGGVARFQGNIKSKRPLKGGGSVSGKVWNNNGQPIGGGRPDQRDDVARFQGNVKARRPDKGGGSVSGKLWNNNGQPIGGGLPEQGASVARFQGNVKARRPDKGGGSVSGKLWNNRETPIAGRAPVQGGRAALYQGNIKSKQPEKGGGSVSGKLWNNRETPIAGRAPSVEAQKIDGYPVRIKRFEVQPGFSDQGELFKGYIRRKWDYVHNPSSTAQALKTREPGKAYASTTAYQGNVKMQKYTLFEKNRALHPDAKFVKTNKNNVDGERDMLTNFKLWWARMFKEQEKQPDHLKYKGKTPRYDKGEEGMWNE